MVRAALDLSPTPGVVLHAVTAGLQGAQAVDDLHALKPRQVGPEVPVFVLGLAQLFQERRVVVEAPLEVLELTDPVLEPLDLSQ